MGTPLIERILNLPTLPHHPSNMPERPATWPGAHASLYRYVQVEYPDLDSGEELLLVGWLLGRADTRVMPDPDRPELFVAVPSDEARTLARRALGSGRRG